jgi:DNA helicase-2/ATP-dependent DNA helicase PcrA
MSFNRDRLEKKFREEYGKLNERQRLAVDTIEGPVMVIAGPGTGKTQILASRIGKILLETQVDPWNILCLTYTDAGVVAMRKRLLEFIGPNAHKVNISTFHAFCNDVIQENLFLFEKTEMDAVSELEKIQIFKELIDGFPKNHPLKRYRGDVYFEINNLQSLFSTMKKEGLTPEFINQRIDEYITTLPDKDEYIYKTSRAGKWNKGDRKPAYQDELDRMEKLRAAVNEFPHFQQLMRRKNRYDFDDMINWVIRAFEENANLLANYQERFQYILVDEYQDTSGTQNRLVELLISFWDKPNVFVVGDDDQSIYRFQGANVENMKHFSDSYASSLLTVVLTNNYRSVQPILDISKTLIGRNQSRLIGKLPGVTKDLVASRESIRHLTHPPVLKEYQSQRQEMIGIAREVHQLVRAGTMPGRIGVIYKENKYGEELGRYLQLLKVPVYTKKSSNIIELPLARKIILVFRYLAAEHDIPYSGDEMLFEILHFDWFGVPAIEIAKLSIEAAENRYGGPGPSSIRQLMAAKSSAPPKDLFSSGLHEGLKHASKVFEELIADAPNITLQSLFECIIKKAGILNRIMQGSDKHWQLQVLTGLFDFVKDETHRDPFMDLKKLVGLFELMQKEGISVPLVQVSGSDQGVNLMTVHGSKGLEFEHVFFAGCNAGFWEKKRKPGGGYKYPDNLFSTPASEKKAMDEEELRRLFYVALTRAEQHLQISYSKFKNDGKELEPSMFIAEILDEHALVPEKIFFDEEVLSEFSALQYGEAESPEIEKIEEELVSRLLDKFVMNVTALNNYLKCPLEFYFRNLVRIPAPKNEATEFGSAAHFALEKLFRKMQDGGKNEFPPRQVFIEDFKWYMDRHRESFTREEFVRRMEYGYEVLGNYYDKYIDSFNRIVAIERNIRHVVVKGVPLKGKIDKIEFDGKLANVVDYKTGDPEKAAPKLQGPSEKQPLGGDYWRQAVFYKILIDNYGQKDWNVVSSEFDFIEPDKKKQYRKFRLPITDADITTVTQQITSAWQKIQDRDFYTGCGKDDCHWCNFIKTNDLAVALHPIDEEEEV